ncbi:MAG: acyltransferase [Anaerovoracaceae bacterium]|jgi:surface polysaccharide O-acyltransferase-like enzyme
MMTQRTTIDAFVYLRIAACFGIVVLHSLFATTVYYDDSLAQGQLYGAAAAEHLLMWCVPCFLMVTGALLLDPQREVPLEKLFGRYIRRIAVALVLFTFIFQLLDFLVGENSTLIPGFFRDLIYGKSWAHMWYLYLILGLYLLLPAYKAVIDRVSDRALQYLIAVLLVFTSVIPVLQHFGMPVAFYISTSLVYPLYLLLGYYIHTRKMDQAMVWLLLCGCSAALVVLTALRWSGAGHVDGFEQLFGYASPLVVGQACGVFGLLDNIKYSPAPAFWRSVDRCTFGIYLIHMIFIHWIFKWQHINPFEYGAWFFPVSAVVFFLISYAIAWAVRKIPKVDLL